MIPGFDRTSAEIDMWRNLQNARSADNKAHSRKHVLQKCQTENITPPWALLLSHWTHDFTKEEKDKLIAVEKEH